MKRKVTYRPSKASSVMGGVMGAIFVLIGVFAVIPTFGPFGVFWTLAACVITGINLYHAFGKGYIGPKIEIEDEGGASAESAGERLKKLQSLYDQRLITPEEYEQKRKEILEEL